MNLKQANVVDCIRGLFNLLLPLAPGVRSPIVVRHVQEEIDRAGLPLKVLSLSQFFEIFTMAVQVPEGDDAEEYCAAVEALIDYPGLRVEPYKVPELSIPDARGYVELGGSAEPDTYEVGTHW